MLLNFIVLFFKKSTLPVLFFLMSWGFSLLFSLQLWLCLFVCFLLWHFKVEICISRDVMISCSSHWKKLELAQVWYLLDTFLSPSKKEINSYWDSWLKLLEGKVGLSCLFHMAQTVSHTSLHLTLTDWTYLSNAALGLSSEESSASVIFSQGSFNC